MTVSTASSVAGIMSGTAGAEIIVEVLGTLVMLEGTLEAVMLVEVLGTVEEAESIYYYAESLFIIYRFQTQFLQIIMIQIIIMF